MDAIAQPLSCAIVHFCHRIQAYLNYGKSCIYIYNQHSCINNRVEVLAPGICTWRAFNLSQLILAQLASTMQVVALGSYQIASCNQCNIVVQAGTLAESRVPSANYYQTIKLPSSTNLHIIGMQAQSQQQTLLAGNLY